uniref:LAM_G_DOMAIN domain-containing protein n=1 Tax=Parastrongyloides trichosuri TaxID=131310 RepID=A0A0N5A5S0_PARTI
MERIENPKLIHFDSPIKYENLYIPKAKIALVSIRDIVDYGISIKAAIFFGICPLVKFSQGIYRFFDRNGRGYFKKITKQPECSLWRCQIGLYIYAPSSDNINIFINTKFIKDMFYIGLRTIRSFYPLILDRYKYDHYIYYLVPCPYKKWIKNEKFITYDISSHLKNGNGIIQDNGKYSFIFTPIYPRKKYDKYFICGKIKQPGNIGVILVGYELEYKNLNQIESPVFNDQFLNKKCDSRTNLERNNTFSYSPEEIIAGFIVILIIISIIIVLILRYKGIKKQKKDQPLSQTSSTSTISTKTKSGISKFNIKRKKKTKGDVSDTSSLSESDSETVGSQVQGKIKLVAKA